PVFLLSYRIEPWVLGNSATLAKTAVRLCVGHQREHPERAARASLYFQRSRDNQSSGRRQLIKVLQALQAISIGPVHQRVTRKRHGPVDGLAGIRVNSFYAKAQYIAFVYHP